MNVNGLVEGLGPDPTGELTALAQTSWVDFGERKLRKWKREGGREKEGKERARKRERKRK